MGTSDIITSTFIKCKISWRGIILIHEYNIFLRADVHRCIAIDITFITTTKDKADGSYIIINFPIFYIGNSLTSICGGKCERRIRPATFHHININKRITSYLGIIATAKDSVYSGRSLDIKGDSTTGDIFV